MQSEVTCKELGQDQSSDRAISVLDRTPIINLHKIGVVYVGWGQSNETEILANTVGSLDYVEFLKALGPWVRLHGCKNIYTGGLDTENDLDGRIACYWKDDIAQVIFHTATMMPTNVDADPQCYGKKRHIGNDFVMLVFNESGSPHYSFHTLPSQFNFVNILIRPIPNSTASDGIGGDLFELSMQCREDMPEMGPLIEPKIVSNVGSVATFLRQVAIHANIFAQVFQQLLRSTTGTPMTTTPAASRQLSTLLGGPPPFSSSSSSSSTTATIIGGPGGSTVDLVAQNLRLLHLHQPSSTSITAAPPLSSPHTLPQPPHQHTTLLQQQHLQQQSQPALATTTLMATPTTTPTPTTTTPQQRALLQKQYEYVSNTRERLRQLKRIQERCRQSSAPYPAPPTGA